MNEEEMLEMYRRAAVSNDPRNPSCVAEAVIWLASEVRALRLALVAPTEKPRGIESVEPEKPPSAQVIDLMQALKDGLGGRQGI